MDARSNKRWLLFAIERDATVSKSLALRQIAVDWRNHGATGPKLKRRRTQCPIKVRFGQVAIRSFHFHTLYSTLSILFYFIIFLYFIIPLFYSHFSLSLQFLSPYFVSRSDDNQLFDFLSYQQIVGGGYVNYSYRKLLI